MEITIKLTEKEIATICKAVEDRKRKLYRLAENETLSYMQKLDMRLAQECYDVQSKLTMLRYKR